MPPYGYYPFQRPPPQEEDLSAGYEGMIRGGPTDPRQLGLMRFLQPAPFYGPSQGIGGPVPRGTSQLPEPNVSNPQFPYQYAMGGAEPEMQGPPEQAVRIPESASMGGESNYRKIADEYLQSLMQPYHLPEPAPYSKREKLGLLAAREPWQREVIMGQHREPYERAMAEAQIGERRRASAAGVASDLEKAQAYERYRVSRQNQPSQELDYVDKVEKAQADVGNTDYPYTKRQWKALADFKAQTAGNKLPDTKEGMLKEIDTGIRTEEDQILRARADVMGMPLPEEMIAPDRRSIIGDAAKRKQGLVARRSAIAGMTPDIYRKFRNLTADQQEEVIRAYAKRQTATQGGGPEQLGPVAPAPQYYP
jgi:hypothetical protein